MSGQFSKFNHGGARINSGGARAGAGRKPNARAEAIADVDNRARWYCVRTGFGDEIAADIAIRRDGFEVFNPTLWKAATRPRQGRPGKPERIVPLFPRYLFARFNRAADDWGRIWRLPSVDFIFSDGDRPVAVPDAAIDDVRGLCHPNGCVYPASHRAVPLPLGAKARLIAGPMADSEGICTWSDGARVRLLMQLLGRGVTVTVAQAAVEVV